MHPAVVKVRQYLLSGVSFAIPFIACGGILIAGAIASVPLKPVQSVLPAVSNVEVASASVEPFDASPAGGTGRQMPPMVADKIAVDGDGEVVIYHGDQTDFVKGCRAIGLSEGKAKGILLPGGRVIVGPDGKMLAADVPVAGGPDFAGRPIRAEFLNIGVAAFTLMPAILAGYIANAIAGKPALVSGFVGGWLVTHIPNGVDVHGTAQVVTAGFLGAMVAGLLGGYVVQALKKPKVPKFVRPIMPILIIPIVSAVVVGVLMLNVIGLPIAHMMDAMGAWLSHIPANAKVLLGLLLGAMIAFDMGGPVNKVAFFFGSGLIAQGRPEVMGAVATAICVPPIGLGLATFLGRKIWTEAEREAGVASFAMGFVGITEGAIPFAAADPLRVIPSIMFGSAVGATIALLAGVADHAPHGGPIVIFVVDNKLMYIVAITVGVVVTALTVNAVKALTRGSDVDAAGAAA